MTPQSPTLIGISLPTEQLDLLSTIDKNLSKFHTSRNTAVWLTMQEICERLKVKESTIRKWMSDFSLPYSKLGEVTRFNADKIDAWFNKFSSDDFSEGIKIINSKNKRKAA
jgi:excisionase family DNA binding protein